TVYLNRALQDQPGRLKFDLACLMAHKVLHGGDRLKSIHATGGQMGGSPQGTAGHLSPQDVLQAWRDFECSFFAGALLAPRAPFPHWHFLDAYPPGYLRAVYRGNGIPLPWGNMAQATDPCPHWAVFRMLNRTRGADRGSQISVLRDGDQFLLYACHTRRTQDM